MENLCPLIKLSQQECVIGPLSLGQKKKKNIKPSSELTRPKLRCERRINKNPHKVSGLPFPLQYIEKEEAMNILQFWLAADNFQNQLAAKKGQYDGLEAQNDAMILYDK